MSGEIECCVFYVLRNIKRDLTVDPEIPDYTYKVAAEIILLMVIIDLLQIDYFSNPAHGEVKGAPDFLYLHTERLSGPTGQPPVLCGASDLQRPNRLEGLCCH